MSSSLRPTTSKSPIFLLKTKSTPHDGYDEYFTAHGYEPRFIPVLEHKFHNANLQIVQDLYVSGTLTEKYGGLIFTSQRAVEGFASAMHNVEIGESSSSDFSSFPLYTVGPATYRSLCALRDSHLPQAPVLGHDTGTGDKLALFILDHYNGKHPALKKKENEETPNNEAYLDRRRRRLPLLFVVGKEHRDSIPKTLMSTDLPPEQRIQVEELIVYETGVMGSFETAFKNSLAEVRLVDDGSGNQDNNTGSQEIQGEEEEEDCHGVVVKSPTPTVWIVVFSPTGCDIMLQTLGLAASSTSGPSQVNLRRNCYIATIGPTTRDHLRSEFGIEPDVCAQRPSSEGLGAGIEEFMARRRREEENVP